MNDRSQVLYLMHAERRLLDQVYQRRYHALGLSWEEGLAWVQSDGDRIQRLIGQKILRLEGESLRLSPIIRRFWEQWDSEQMSALSWPDLQADWVRFQAELLLPEDVPEIHRQVYWQERLPLWQTFLKAWPEADKRSAKQYLDGLQKALSSLLQQKPGLEQGLEKQVLLLLDLLIGINQSLLTEVVETDLFQQISVLQSLRERDLLFANTDLGERLGEERATLWNAKTGGDKLWPSLDHVWTFPLGRKKGF